MSRKARSSYPLSLNLVPRNVEGPSDKLPAFSQKLQPIFVGREHRDWMPSG